MGLAIGSWYSTSINTGKQAKLLLVSIYRRCLAVLQLQQSRLGAILALKLSASKAIARSDKRLLYRNSNLVWG